MASIELSALWSRFFRRPQPAAPSRSTPAGLVRLAGAEALLSAGQRPPAVAGLLTRLGGSEGQRQTLVLPLLRGYARFVQHLSTPRGNLYLDAGLRQAHAALALGAAPRAQDAAEERGWLWNYALLSGALLRQAQACAEQPPVEVYDARYQPLGAWCPLRGPLDQIARAAYYRAVPGAANAAPAPGLSALLVAQLVPAQGVTAVLHQAEIGRDWLSVVSGGTEGALSEQLAAAQATMQPPAEEGADIALPEHPLREALLAALRDGLSAEGVSLNCQEAIGWRVGDHLYLVGKQFAELLREHERLQSHRAMLERNARLYQLLVAAGIALPNGGSPVFNGRIAQGGWERQAALLKLPAALIWPDVSARPAAFTGTLSDVSR